MNPYREPRDWSESELRRPGDGLVIAVAVALIVALLLASLLTGCEPWPIGTDGTVDVSAEG